MLFTATIIIQNLSRMKTSQSKSRYHGRWGRKIWKSWKSGWVAYMPHVSWNH